MDPLFHNNTVNINDVWFESHKSLLQMVCVELGHSDKIDDMVEKFLGKKLKMKSYKDPTKPKRASQLTSTSVMMREQRSLRSIRRSIRKSTWEMWPRNWKDVECCI